VRRLLEIIEGTPGELNLLDIVAAEAPVAGRSTRDQPGPFQFHRDPACVRRWMAGRDFLFCRRGEVREICGRSRSRPIHHAGACATHPSRRSRVHPRLTGTPALETRPRSCERG